MSKDDLFDFVPDMDFDGDSDLMDYLLYKDEFEMLMEEENNHIDSFDYEDDDCDYEELNFEDDIPEDTFDDCEDIVLPIKLSLSITTEDAQEADADDSNEFAEESTEVTTERTAEATDRIPDSFIQRNLIKEKEFGIDDLKFYCYWMNGFSGILVIIGEIISKTGIKNPFYLKAIAKDEEGDKFISEENFSYTGGSGFIIKNIYPQIGFDRYPFEFELHLSPEKLKKSNLQIIPIKAEDIADNSVLPPKFECNQNKQKSISVAELKQYDKVPKTMINYCVQDGIDLRCLKVTFFKNNDTYDNDYYLNQLSFIYEYSGKLKEDALMHILIYNEKDELIQFLVKRLDEGEWLEEDDDDFVNLPRNELISRIVVCVTSHPLNFHQFKF